MITLPALRQVVLLSAELPAAIETARGFLGLNRGIRDVASMAQLGFEHEVLAVDQTFLEIVAPLSPTSSSGRLLARSGESGYMVVLQVADLGALLERGAVLGIEPVMNDLLDGNPISQWHPRDLGTLAEIDQIAAGANWHFCPALSDTGSTEVVADIVAAEIAVTDPVATAARWAALLGLAVDPDATQIALASGVLRFVPRTGVDRGLIRVDFARAGTSRDSLHTAAVSDKTVCGVRLTILEQGNQQ